MNKIYRRLAIQNIKNNKSLYIPYIITSSITIFMFYIFLAIQNSPDVLSSRGGESIRAVLALGTVIVVIFSVIFLIYTNQFLVRNRNKELGLLNMLGADKKGITKIMVYESIILTIINLLLGILSSLVFSTLIFLLIGKFLSLEITQYIYIDFKSILITIGVFLVIFLIVLMGNIVRAKKLKPLDLLKDSEKGEKEPKASILLTIIGILCMVTGYVLAQRITNIIEALSVFFIAVVLVIIGTYLLFTTVSIAILKILKKNKKIYYKSKNMTFISTMLFRMKQNAVSLANICIISTMVLVMLVSTTSLIASGNYIIDLYYPSDIAISYIDVNKDIEKDIKETLDKNLNKEIKISDYNVITNMGIGTKKISDSKYEIMDAGMNIDLMKSGKLFSIYSEKDYNKITGENIKLSDDEILLHQNQGDDLEKLSINNIDFKVKENLDDIDKHFIDAESMTFSAGTIIAKDWNSIYDKIINSNKNLEEFINKQTYTYFNVAGDEKTIENYTQNTVIELNEKYGENEDGFNVLRLENKVQGGDGIVAMHTGIYLVTILLSTIFLVAMVMIIYYKQLSEGIEDAKNINILKKIGMSDKDVRKQVGKQTRTIFFMPLLISIIHLIGATKLIYLILKVIGIANIGVFIKAELVTVLVYIVFYLLVYKISSNAYYNIINRNQR